MNFIDLKARRRVKQGKSNSPAGDFRRRYRLNLGFLLLGWDRDGLGFFLRNEGGSHFYGRLNPLSRRSRL
jgi:hypothetical protein